MIEFLPLDQYQQFLQRCGIVVMNHYRKQAVVNVLTSLYMGAKVYLSNKSTLYYYLRRIGCHNYCVEEDFNPENETALKLLETEQMMHDRNILWQELHLDNICKELKDKVSPLIA